MNGDAQRDERFIGIECQAYAMRLASSLPWLNFAVAPYAEMAANKYYSIACGPCRK